MAKKETKSEICRGCSRPIKPSAWFCSNCSYPHSYRAFFVIGIVALLLLAGALLGSSGNIATTCIRWGAGIAGAVYLLVAVYGIIEKLKMPIDEKVLQENTDIDPDLQEEQEIMMAFVNTSSLDASIALVRKYPQLNDPGALTLLDTLMDKARQSSKAFLYWQLSTARERLDRIHSQEIRNGNTTNIQIGGDMNGNMIVGNNNKIEK